MEITARITIPDDELELQFARSGGSGGQNVNKVNSKAQLRWSVTTSRALPNDVRHRFLERYASRITNDGAILLQSDQHRDQGQNIDACKERLKELILEVLVPPKPRRPTRPSRGSVERRLKGKNVTSAKKQGRRTSRDDD